MTYVQFYNQWHQFGCFSVQQVKAIHPSFNRSNYQQWQLKGYIVPLRKGWYAFADYKQRANSARFFAGQMYAPSYISLHTVLSFYGIIPEAVVEITSVTTRKTAHFENEFGLYSYQTIRPSLYFGYEMMKMQDGKTYLMATPEKALVDLIYLYPQYQTEQDMRDLRLDEDWVEDEMQISRIEEYLQRIGSPALNKRMKSLLTTYKQLC